VVELPKKGKDTGAVGGGALTRPGTDQKTEPTFVLQ
jgi:hypothetical protein